MTVQVKHTKILNKADGTDSTMVQPTDWNDKHVISAAPGKVLGTLPGSSTVVELSIEVDPSQQSVKLPSGPSASRPASASDGMLRFNSTTNRLEYYVDSAWKHVDNMRIGATASNPLNGDFWVDTSDNNTLKVFVNNAWLTVFGSGSIQQGQLAAPVLQALNPTGAVLPFAGVAAPAGWLLCYGQAVSRSTYAALYRELGGAASPYGHGDGTTTFNVPDLRGRVPAGKDDMGGIAASRITTFAGNALGATGGAETHVLVEKELPAHRHLVASNTGTNATLSGTNFVDSGYTGSSSNNDYNLRGITGEATLGQTSKTGSGASHNNIQPTIILNYIIKT